MVRLHIRVPPPTALRDRENTDKQNDQPCQEENTNEQNDQSNREENTEKQNDQSCRDENTDKNKQRLPDLIVNCFFEVLGEPEFISRSQSTR